MHMASAPMAAASPVDGRSGRTAAARSLACSRAIRTASSPRRCCRRSSASPIELDLPSRVGVLPIITATDWRGPSPDYERVPPGVAPLVARLRKDAAFSLVTEMMPIPSGALGMEALREVAARYRLRYVMLYREVLAKKTHHNAWAWGYATGVGALFLPGQQHEVYGYIEATMFDVKTGLLMFTTRRAVDGAREQHERVAHRATSSRSSRRTRRSKFAPELAHRLPRSTCAGSRTRRSPRTTSCTCPARRSSIRPKLRRSRPTRTDDVGATSTSIGCASWPNYPAMLSPIVVADVVLDAVLAADAEAVRIEPSSEGYTIAVARAGELLACSVIDDSARAGRDRAARLCLQRGHRWHRPHARAVLRCAARCRADRDRG